MRSPVPFQDQTGGETRNLRLKRAILQPGQNPLEPGRPNPDRIRTTTVTNCQLK